MRRMLRKNGKEKREKQEGQSMAGLSCGGSTTGIMKEGGKVGEREPPGGGPFESRITKTGRRNWGKGVGKKEKTRGFKLNVGGRRWCMTSAKGRGEGSDQERKKLGRKKGQNRTRTRLSRQVNKRLGD